jgi:hypothetical protein
MKNSMKALALAVLLVSLHLGLRALGLAEHMSAIAGMPASSSSWAIAPLYIVSYFLAVVVAPIVALASVLTVVERGLRM